MNSNQTRPKRSRSEPQVIKVRKINGRYRIAALLVQ
jgi:hypothetical protein